jgi:hypothetical protein
MSLLLLSLFACGEPEPEPCTELTFFLDADGDGHGGDVSVQACQAPEGHVAQSTDCDDDDSASHPDANELCDGVDNDCDGTPDNAPTDGIERYVDVDGDGFGDPDSGAQVCADATGYVDDATDCDDDNPDANPDAEEVCDGADNDCDGATDGFAYPGDFDSLWDATQAMADGDMLCIAAGEYDESLEITGKQLHIGGAGSDQTRLGLRLDQPAVLLDDAGGAVLSGLSVQGMEIEASDGVVVRDVDVSGTACGMGQCKGSALYVEQSTVAFEELTVQDNTQSYSGSGSPYLVGMVWFEYSDVSWVGGVVHDNDVSGFSSAGTVNLHGLVGFGYSAVTLESVSIHDNAMSAVSQLNMNGTASVNSYGLLYGYESDLVFTDVDMVDNQTTCEGVNAKPPGEGHSGGNGHAGCYGLWRVSSNLTWDWAGGEISGNTVDGTSSNGGYAFLADTSGTVWDVADLSVHDNHVTSDVLAGTCQGFYQNSSTGHWTRADLRDNSFDCEGAEFGGLIGGWFGPTTLENVVLAGNLVEMNDGTVGGLLWLYGANLDVTNSTLHDNLLMGGRAYGGLIYVQNGQTSLTNTAMTYNQLGVDAWDSSHPASVLVHGNSGFLVEHSGFWANSSSSNSMSWDQGETDVHTSGTADPGYADTSSDAPTDWDLSLAAGSAYIDAGDPEISDADGSTSDIGAYGGPESF